ncbi:MAG: transcriptional repressor NrdR [Deltaproteobacteria bacterium]|jgi:transcriptional repressor NrdR|nr:transcriptional repressor NrdR [Deltaproteobacteria bacterium]
MKCPYCGHLENKVIDSRLSVTGEVTRRRRECDGCQRRYTTYERVEDLLPTIVKRDGRRELFDRRKVIHGVRQACSKRPVSLEQIDGIAESVERELQEAGEREVTSTHVGEKVMEKLRGLDQVAYVRFASVYRKFRDIEDFAQEVAKLVTERSSQ